ncbi:MAG: J domain-containing protein [Treponema sp.]|jgi:curved DNA-binding protein CbpA|nr:J domain-containing protein [Treponema sp.]
MENYYSLLAVKQNASTQEIKRAFREKAKLLHPDIAGKTAEEAMRKLLTAYEVLSDRDRRHEYDRAYGRFIKKIDFDYRAWLREQAEDPLSQAKLVFFELLHLEEDAAIAVWDRNGGLDFAMERFLDREDWMDCVYILAEELDRRDRCYEAFTLLAALVREERRRPYFRHFMDDIEGYLKELVRLRLKSRVDAETWVECMETLLGLGFSPRDEARWMRSLAEALLGLGDTAAAGSVMREALKKDPALSNAAGLRRRLKV